MAIELVDKSAVNLTESELKTFLSSKRIIVADKGKTAGRSIRKFLMQFGAKPDLTFVCETFDDAKREIAAGQTHLLITDITFMPALIPLQEEPFPNRADIATIVLSPDPASTVVGMIAEANVDALLVTPFNFKTFKDALEHALATKIKPTPYWTMLEKGKAFLKQGSLDEALVIFENTKTLDPKPMLGFYYVGQVLERRGDGAGALDAYGQGLLIDPKDYRCLLGSFDGAMKAAKYSQAYEIATRFHAHYPVSASRIPQLVSLSVHVRRFTDIQDYYKVFKGLEQKDPLLNRVIIAGMLVCAKYCSLRGERKLTGEIMRSAAAIGMETKLLLPDIVRYFAETGQADEGANFFGHLTDDDQQIAAIRIEYLEILHIQGISKDLLDLGLKLAQEGKTTPRLYQLLLVHSKKGGRTADTLTRLLEEATGKYPDQRTLFEKALAG